MTEWTFDFNGTPVTYGMRGKWRYVLDLAASKCNKRKEIGRQCDCFEGCICDHEEPIRQYAEKWLHDKNGIPYSRIISEAPVKIGSSEKFADVVVLRNENNPISPENYFVVVETKRESGFVHSEIVESAKMQLFSYLGASNAVVGIIFTSDLVALEFQKDINGKILLNGSKDLGPLEAVPNDLRKNMLKNTGMDLNKSLREIEKILQVGFLNKEISRQTIIIWNSIQRQVREQNK
ncbi:MAG TPA: type I restriction enzyme HsdR N-terminal domain-containing protein [Methylomirabilota bacterium]|nr:type I restriction enzyme HsdR N-terminal domain-containing protein [Methylomirabilota bacterium]